ncbi:anti-sigma factor [Chitinophaga sp. G-6-1-13]|uniref:Anti-sigma factor n=1 Tax=Chitinophaga fulva TaxID=2728842 RepID=A0A848GWT5_9BACT|nr:anti-sigma factor [Chitinophaga fulva]NML41682.1 anti-sigma factor [Chitinophaga fulva]
MDAQFIISSGLIELYTAGLTSEKESQELEAAMRQYPEVAAAVATCQRNLEEYVKLQSISPPESIKIRLLNLINTDPLTMDTATTNASIPQLTKTSPMEQTNVLSVPETKGVSWKWIAAAAAVLLIGSVILNFFYFNRWKEFREYKDKYQSLLLSQNSIISKTNEYKTRLEQLSESMGIMENPKVMKVAMPGTPAFPTAVATVFWNQDNKQVYLKVNNLPEPAADKQYQLWAIVDGKPVDMGVFEMGDTASLLQKMKITGKAQMFAVTLEKKGGAVSPTMEQMYVAGKIPG